MFLVLSTATLVLDVMFQIWISRFVYLENDAIFAFRTVTYDSLSKDDKASVVLLSSYFLFLQQVNWEIWLIVK